MGGTMSKKIVVIEYCDDCPHFNNEYYGYDHECIRLCRVIEEDETLKCPIPDDCPLDNE